MNSSRTQTNPLVFLFLVLPYGISSGFASVTIPFLLTQHGFTVAEAASITALGISSNIWRFIWAPLADLTLTLHKWYILGTGFCAVTLALIGFVPLNTHETGFITFLVFLSQVAATFVVLPVGGFMAKTVSEDKKGRAGGWYQAGNLGGAIIGGGAGIWLTVHYAFRPSAILISIFMLLCVTALWFVPKVPVEKAKSVLGQLKIIGKDIKNLFRSRIAVFTIIMVLTPIGSGAASNVWSSVASDWKVTVDMVALVTGGLNGAVCIVGCMAGGWLADKLGRWWAYFGSGALMAIVTLYMSLVHLVPGNYISGVLLYAFTTGLAYAAFSAIILHAIGKGAAATKYAFLSSLGNIPVVYMTALDGWSHDHFGVKMMLLLETIAGIAFVGMSLIALAKTKLYKINLVE